LPPDIILGQDRTLSGGAISYPVAEPGTMLHLMLHLGSGLISIAGFGRKKFFKK
jgi:hypothetical protein